MFKVDSSECRRARAAVTVGLLVSLGVSTATAQTSVTPSKPAATARPPIYDAKADAGEQIKAAREASTSDGKRILVMFGFNGCSWCHKLHGLLASDETLARLVRDEFRLVMVDVESPHADELLSYCKLVLGKDELAKGVGYPFLAVLDGRGQVIAAQRTDPLEVGDHHDPALVRALLEKWVAPDANAVVTSALARASSEGKLVLLHFGAPWCGWCHKLEGFLARDDVAAIVGQDYLDVKVDVDRMKHGQDVLDRYTHGKQGGIPWFVVLDGAGKALATSDGPDGNIGYPVEPREIEHFLSMVRKTARRIEPAQVEALGAALEAEARKIKEERARKARPASPRPAGPSS